MLNKSRVFLMVLSMLLLISPVFSMMAAVSEPELVATSDLIVIGTIGKVWQIPDVPSWNAGRAEMKVEKVLKGSPMEELLMTFPTVPVMPPGMIIMDHGGMSFTAGQRQLFFLQRSQSGYTIVGNYQGVKQVTEADKFGKLLQSQPLTIQIKEISGAFIIGQKTSITLLFTNNSKTDILRVYSSNPEAYFLSDRMGSYVSLSVVQPIDFLQPKGGVEPIMPLDAAAGNEKKMIAPIGGAALPPPELQPGESKEIKLTLKAEMPQGWQIFAGTYIQTPINFRIKSFIQKVVVQDAGGNEAQFDRGFQFASPWNTAMLGFAVPEVGK